MTDPQPPSPPRRPSDGDDGAADGGPVRTADPAGTTAEGPPAPRAGRHEARVGLAATVVAVVAVAVACWRSASSWVPTTDWALIELQVRDVWTSPPLLGAPSAVGFHHPGPLPYLVLAPLYRLFGADPRALALAVGVVSCASVAAVAATAWRRGGLVPLLAATAVVTWLAGSLPAGSLVDPWNPWVAVLPFAWLLVLVWSVLDDDLVALPLAALAASFVVQAHVAYLVPVGALTVVVVAALVRRRRGAAGDADAAVDADRDADRRRRRWWIGAAVGVLVLAWIGPLVEQVTADEGNVSLGIEYLRSDEATDRLPAGDALGVAATELGWPGPWLTGDEPVDELALQVQPSSPWRLVVPVAALAGAAWLARGDRSATRLVVVAAVAMGASFLAIFQLEVDRAFPYAVRAAWVAGAAAGLAVVVAGAGWALRRWPGWRTAVVGVGLALVALAGGRVVAAAGDAVVPVYSPDGRALEQACLDQLLPGVRGAVGDGPVHVRLAEFWPVMSAPIVNELDRAGVPWAVDERFGFHVERTGREPGPGEVALVVVDEALRDDWEDRPGVVEVARCDLLDADERAEIAELAAIEDPTPLDRISLFDLVRRADRTVVYVDRSG